MSTMTPPQRPDGLEYFDAATVLERPGQAHGRTCKVAFNGCAVWVKRAEAKGFPLAPTVQRRLEWPGMYPVLRCTFIFDRRAALAFEAGRLRALAAAGHPVPHVLAQSAERMVLSDAGTSLWLLLRNGAADISLARKAGAALARLHLAGDFHGQPYPKNLTWDGRGVHFIDTEDDALRVMPLADAQLRDVWLFAHGCWPLAGRMPDVARHGVEAYAQEAGARQVERLRAGLKGLSGAHARIVHAAISTDVAQNIRRYRWTLGQVRAGLSL